MAFNVNKFANAQFKQKTKEIDVPLLAQFFDEGENPVWVVKGLTGIELSKSHQAYDMQNTVSAVVEALVSQKEGDKVDAIREMLGTSDSVPPQMAIKIEQLVLGSVSPEITREHAATLFRAFPVIAFHLVRNIEELTTQGSDVGKLRPSGKIQKSN